jgi:hypothetical protein
VHERRKQTVRQAMCVVDSKAPLEIPALKPYWGKPTVRDFRGSGGDVGIIRSPVRATALPGNRISWGFRMDSDRGAARIKRWMR